MGSSRIQPPLNPCYFPLLFSYLWSLHLDRSPLYLTQFACLCFFFWTTEENFGNKKPRKFVGRETQQTPTMGSCASGTTVHSAGSTALVRSQPRHCDNKMGKPQAIPSTPPPQGTARSLTRTSRNLDRKGCGERT